MAEEKQTFKYGVEDLAKSLGIQAASARVALRKAGVEKSGSSYGWNNDKDFKSVVSKLQSASKPEPKTAAKKPAAKSTDKKAKAS